MSEHYDFHYQPTGSGAISGQQVLQQTEDAINELGDYVNDNVGGAMDVAQQALETAQNAEQDAQTALDTANSFSDAIQSAQQDASTALSTAQTAQTTASNANNTAIQAQQDASSAVTTANNASGQVNTLSGTVTALGQRVTTAEGNIGQNTSDITALTTRVGTAEGNITTLQNDVSIAQGNASSAMATAGQVKQQAFVFRYSSTALVASSTNSNTLLDNTDNLKVGDKVIDSSGVLFSITAIDTQNSTFTIGTALIDLAQDSDVVHKSRDETVTGFKQFANIRVTNSIKGINLDSTTTDLNNCYSDFTLYGESRGGNIQYYYCSTDAGTANISNLPEAKAFFLISITTRLISNSLYVKQILINSTSKTYTRYCNNSTWDSWVNETDSEYVHKSGDETIGGVKTFSDNISTKKIISNVAQLQINARSNADSVAVIAGANATDGGGIWLYGKNSANNSVIALQVYDTNNSTFHAARLNMDGSLTPTVSNNGLGSQLFKWKSINGVEPSSLSLPDLSNGIDISSYFDVSLYTGQTYTPIANGWISISITSPNRGSLLCESVGISQTAYGVTDPDDNNKYRVSILVPCQASQTLTTYIRASGGTMKFAKFYPCLGNV